MVISLHVQSVLTEHVNQLREAYHAACQRVKGADESVVNGSSPLAATLKKAIAQKTGAREPT
jgi:hypothetical protein